jgi:hypothetical protein
VKIILKVGVSKCFESLGQKCRLKIKSPIHYCKGFEIYISKVDSHFAIFGVLN